MDVEPFNQPQLHPGPSPSPTKRRRSSDKAMDDQGGLLDQINTTPYKRQKTGHGSLRRADSQRSQAALSQHGSQGAAGLKNRQAGANQVAKTDSTTEEDATTPCKEATGSARKQPGKISLKSAALKGGTGTDKANNEKLEKEMKRIFSLLVKSGAKQALEHCKSRDTLVKSLKKFDGHGPPEGFTRIQTHGGDKKRAYLFEFESEQKNDAGRQVCVVTLREKELPVMLSLLPLPLAESDAEPDADSANEHEEKLPREEEELKRILDMEEAKDGVKRKSSSIKPPALSIESYQKIHCEPTGLNSLQFCTGQPQQEQPDNSELMATIRTFQQQRLPQPMAIPTVTRPKKTNRRNAKAECKQQMAASGGKVVRPSKKRAAAEGSKLKPDTNDQAIKNALLLRAGPKSKKASKAKGAAVTEFERDEHDDLESMCDFLPSIPKKALGEREEASHRRSKKPATGKGSKLQEPGPKAKVELPRQVKEFLAEKSVHYRGCKLTSIKENDMVCKLVYGHLNRTVEVTKKDFKFLEPGVYLNDILVLFYLRFLQYYVIPKPLDEKVYIFDPQFFTKLQESPKHPSKFGNGAAGEDRYSVSHGYKSVKRWTKKIDLFEKEYILVPICQDQHWTLAIILRSHLIERQMKEHIAKCQQKEESKVKEAVDDCDESLKQEYPAHHQVISKMPTDIRAAMTIVSQDADNKMQEKADREAQEAVELLDQTEPLAEADSEQQPRQSLKGGGGGGGADFSDGDCEMNRYKDMDDDEEDDEEGYDNFGMDEDELDSDLIDPGYVGQQKPPVVTQRPPANNKKAFKDDDDDMLSDDEDMMESEGQEDQEDQEGYDSEDEYGDQYENYVKHTQNQLRRPAGLDIFGYPGELAGWSQAQQAPPRKPVYVMPEKACSDKPIILFMDSLHADSVDEMMQSLREYLELEFIEKKVAPEHKKYFLEAKYEWRVFDQTRVPHYQPKLPKQQNFTDCGLFVLQYAETFLSKPDFVLHDLHQKSGSLFHQRIVDSKRDEIMRIIIAIAEQTASIQHIGKVQWEQLQRMQGKKTHYALQKPDEASPAKQEESKASLQRMEVLRPGTSTPDDPDTSPLGELDKPRQQYQQHQIASQLSKEASSGTQSF